MENNSKNNLIYVLIALITFIVLLDSIYIVKAFQKSSTNTENISTNTTSGENIYSNEIQNKIYSEEDNLTENISSDEYYTTINKPTLESPHDEVIDVAPKKEESINELKNTYQVQNIEKFKMISPLNFNIPDSYNNASGITTFRGNNFRDTAFYGSLDVTEKKLSKVWNNNIGQTDNWTGVGWNGQPSIIKWDTNTKIHMNIYDKFKEKEDFIEVIYGALDSGIHFYDLETGEETRPTIYVDSSIKGSVTIDSRGYPILYVAQGIDTVSGEAVKIGYHIFSLITGEELYFINGRDTFAYIGWGAFDGNPLINAESDTMILPGENGIVYIVKLNTVYNEQTGELSLSPVTTKYRYTVNGKAGGMENSITAYKNKAYFLNNNGILHCLNLTTLEPEWSYSMGDDCDATLGLELEEDKLMLYAASEVDKQKQDGPAYARKIDAQTGKMIWEYSCQCKYDANVNGGALSSPVIGKNKISNLVIFNFSKVTTLRDGKMVALDKNTGNVVWEKELTYYSWSSPVAIYTNSGDAYIIFCDSVGRVLLIEAETGKTLYTLNTNGGNIEGSPAIYNNKIVIGTRGKKIYCIEIN